jgi:hypothetical protein
MKEDRLVGGPPKRYIRKGSFVAEITSDGSTFRSVIRDENGTSPPIHGSKKSMQEMEAEIRAVLDHLCARNPTT